MILRSFLHTDPVAISCLSGCGRKASATVVDPVGDIAPYLDTADATGRRIHYVVDTHIHADHVSASRRLADVAGAEYVLFAGAEAAPPFHGHGDQSIPLFRSLRRLKELPDHVEVLPGAFSGSVCGRRLSGKPFSTIGFERRHNAAFRIEHEDAFVQLMQEEIPLPPPHAAELRGINAGSLAP
jgi:hydroxyacylglutathione hydrolase